MRPRTTMGIDPTIGLQYPHLGSRRRVRPPRVLQGLGENPAALAASTVETLQKLLADDGSWAGGVTGDWTPELVPAINDCLTKRQIPIPTCDPQAAYAALRAAFVPTAAARIAKAPFTPAELTALAEVYAAECAAPADEGNGDGVPKPAGWWKKNWGWVAGGVATAALGIGGFLWWRRKQEQTGTAGLGCGCTSSRPQLGAFGAKTERVRLRGGTLVLLHEPSGRWRWYDAKTGQDIEVSGSTRSAAWQALAEWDPDSGNWPKAAVEKLERAIGRKSR